MDTPYTFDITFQKWSKCEKFCYLNENLIIHKMHLDSMEMLVICF